MSEEKKELPSIFDLRGIAPECERPIDKDERIASLERQLEEVTKSCPYGHLQKQAQDRAEKAESRNRELEKEIETRKSQYRAVKEIQERLEKELAEAKRHLCPECGDNKCEYHTLPDNAGELVELKEKNRLLGERNRVLTEALLNVKKRPNHIGIKDDITGNEVWYPWPAEEGIYAPLIRLLNRCFEALSVPDSDLEELANKREELLDSIGRIDMNIERGVGDLQYILILYRAYEAARRKVYA